VPARSKTGGRPLSYSLNEKKYQDLLLKIKDQRGEMEMNWLDMLSMISSPEPLFLFSSHFSVFFLQQVGDAGFLPSDAEELSETKAVPMAMTKAAMNSRLIFFMVVVLQFDETICENVTVNIKILWTGHNRNLTKRRIGAMECQNRVVNC
jgi:hypothetical protein